MGILSGVLEGTLEARARRDLLPRVADRARGGRFGAPGRAYDVEDVADEARGGYRDAQRIPAIRLRLQAGQPASAIDQIELDVDETGGLRYRAAISSARRLRQLAPLASLALGASLVAFVLYAYAAAPLLALPILLSIAFMIFSSVSRMDARWRTDVLLALRREIDDARIDAALEPTGTNATLARDVVVLLESRAVALTDDERARILECDDEVALGQWMQNARLAASASEIFDGPRLRVAADPPVEEEEAEATGEAPEEEQRS